MSLHEARLSKIIKIAYADAKLSRKEIFNDVSACIRKEQNPESGSGGGGDFHGVLWAAFKECIFEQDVEGFDQMVAALISGNSRRKRLFPQLADGLKSWGLLKRRWMNEEIKRIKNPVGTVILEGQDIAFKVNNVLALEIVGKGNRYIYPYFSEKPALNDEAARVALWQLHCALPHVHLDEIRILDVMRGKSYSTVEVPLVGDEHDIFAHQVAEIFQLWDKRYQDRKNGTA
ncbi:hypothetical protein ACFO5Q_17235 [Kordiimonas lipolytica]|uniref:Uncharacterized protein n=1 Tax=Kordiimonas lipolytica TaxID=1662421 RepID=A0ABV8UEB1_9PROT|nr:hypothetical protein [Kordiimonas lipolytica]